MKKFGLILILLIPFFLFVPYVSAQVAKSGELVVLPKETVIDENYFASGETVTLAGTVNGDAYLVGGKINVEGTVNGDILAAGGVITISGNVTEDIRLAGGQINITGTIGGNITVAGGSITVSDDAEIAGSIVAAGGSVDILAPVGGTVTAGAGQLTIANVVNGNVLAGVGELSLSPNSNIQGNLTYYSEDNVELQQGATVSGTINHQQPPVTKQEASEAANMAKGILRGLSITWQLISLVSAFIVGSLLVYFFPNFMKRTTEIISNRPWFTFGIGLFTVILTPILFLFLLSTIVGIPLSLMLIFAYIALMYLAKIPVALFIGDKVLGMANARHSSLIVSLLVGLVIYGILHFIPVIGTLVGIATLFIGIGALLLTKQEFYKSLRATNKV